jgi:uncharacterized membrane protein
METFYTKKVSNGFFISKICNPLIVNTFMLMSKAPFSIKSIVNYFLQGLLVVAPIAITSYIIYAIVSSIDNLIPIFSYTNDKGQFTRNYGLGFLCVIIALIIIGFFSSFFVTAGLFKFFDKWLERAPGIKYIYSTTRDFFEAFAGDKKKFTQSVLANVDDNDVWRIGFITKTDMADFGLANYVAVYIPTSYSVAGSVYIIPPNRIKPLKQLNAAQAMKFAVSGGVADVTESIDNDNLKK